jgi:formamidopyrimidine-DNA glycosylase
MPELPDIVAYLHALEPRIVGRRIDRVVIASPFLVRSVDPPVSALDGRTVRRVDRIGKRIVIDAGDELFAVLHLMIAGRLHWRAPGPLPRTRNTLAGFVFEHGTLVLTEAGSKRRASLTMARGRVALAALDRGGLDVFSASPEAFGEALRRENHTLKRALTDPRILDGIGNAYSDEILHAARLSPMQWTSRVSDEEMARLHDAAKTVLRTWVERLREEARDEFPEKVTAFRKGMSVHGRFGKPCPRCGAPVQRITYADNECNYCAECQLGGRLLADRALSRLLGQDWPKTLDELEDFKQRRRS